MGVETDVYWLVRFECQDGTGAHHLLARARRGSFSNADQTDEDRAIDEVEAARERVEATYLQHTLSERCRASHARALIGEFQHGPVGDDLHSDEAAGALDVWVAETAFGRPWIILGTVPNEAAFWVEADARLSRLRPLHPARRLSVDFRSALRPARSVGRTK
jgi:hypothetical protein